MSVSRSLAWMGTAQGIGLCLQFAVQIILARYLSIHDAGIYAVALAMMGALSLIQNLGLQSLIIREEALEPEIVSTTFSINALLAVLVSLVILGVSHVGGHFLGDAGVGRVLAGLAVVPLAGIIAFVPLAMLEREGRFKHIALIGSIGSIGGAIVTILSALLGASYMSAVYGQIAAALLSALLLLLTARRHFTVTIGFAGWRRVAAFGLNLLAINGINALGLRLSDIILPRFLGLGQLGLYSRAGGLNGLIWANVHVTVARVMLVDFAELKRQGLSLRTRYLATVDVVTVLLWPIFAGFAVVSGPFIYWVFGERWLPATVPLMLLSLASMVLVAITMTWEVFTASDQLHVQARIEFKRAIAALLLFIAGCAISIEAAAASRVAEALLAVFLYRPSLNRMTDTRASDYWPIYGRNLGLALIATGPAIGVMALHHWRADIALLPLAAGIASGVLLWGGALWAMGHPVAAGVRGFGRARLSQGNG